MNQRAKRKETFKVPVVVLQTFIKNKEQLNAQNRNYLFPVFGIYRLLFAEAPFLIAKIEVLRTCHVSA